jgi:hypothetical protein
MVKLIELFFQRILKTLCLKDKGSQNYKEFRKEEFNNKTTIWHDK